MTADESVIAVADCDTTFHCNEIAAHEMELTVMSYTSGSNVTDIKVTHKENALSDGDICNSL